MLEVSASQSLASHNTPVHYKCSTQLPGVNGNDIIVSYFQVQRLHRMLDMAGKEPQGRWEGLSQHVKKALSRTSYQLFPASCRVSLLDGCSSGSALWHLVWEPRPRWLITTGKTIIKTKIRYNEARVDFWICVCVWWPNNVGKQLFELEDLSLMKRVTELKIINTWVGLYHWYVICHFLFWILGYQSGIPIWSMLCTSLDGVFFPPVRGVNPIGLIPYPKKLNKCSFILC